VSDSHDPNPANDTPAGVELLFETIRDLTSTLSAREVLGRLLDRTMMHLGAEIASILTVDAQAGPLRIAVARGLPDEVVRDAVVNLGDGISGWVAARGESLLISNIEADPRFSRTNHERYYNASALSVPINFRDAVLGVLNVNNKRSRQPFTLEDQRLVEALAGHAAVALYNARRYEDLLERSQHDSLTGLANHGHFWSAVETELSRSERHRHALSLVMIDVDYFKEFNDEHGHVEGDELLMRVARAIKSRCRASDIAARYGGDEFAVVLPETPLAGAASFSRKILATLAAAGGPEVGLSIGVASYPADAERAADLVEAADRRLYEAKAAGRNRVVF